MDDHLYKIIVLGDGCVGKSALTIQFIQSYFVEEYDPTIEDFYRKQCVVDGIVCFLDILDTAGQSEYTVLRDQYMRNGDGFLCVYSIISKSTFFDLQELIVQLHHVKDIDDGCSVPLLIVGNKCDLISRREVSREEGGCLAQKYHTMYMETSARTRTNVDEAFYELVRVIRRNPYRSTSPHVQQKKFSKCDLL